MIIHPLRFARRPCLRGTVSYCLLMQNKAGTTQCDASFIYAQGVSTVLQFYSLFSFSFILTRSPYF